MIGHIMGILADMRRVETQRPYRFSNGTINKNNKNRHLRRPFLNRLKMRMASVLKGDIYR